MVNTAKRTVMVQADFDGGVAGTTPIMRTNKLRGMKLDQIQIHSNAEINYTSNIWEVHFEDTAEAALELNGSLTIKDYGMYVDGWIEIGFTSDSKETIE